MAAPLGNQFWRLRAKHGRDKLFKTPELLWEAATEYFEWCEENPFQEVEQRKGNIIIQKGAEIGDIDISPIVNLPKLRAFTLHGLCIYLDCSTSYFRAFKSTLKEEDKDFLTVITRIEEIIYEQKFTGAAAGFLNQTIIARDLGLKESTVVDANIKTFGKLETE